MPRTPAVVRCAVAHPSPASRSPCDLLSEPARYSAAGLVTISGEGRNPPSTACRDGAARAIWIPKQAKITVRSAITKASSARKPRLIRSRIRKTSSAVTVAPMSSGMPNSSLRAIAVPITSARSQAMMAASQTSQSVTLTGFE